MTDKIKEIRARHEEGIRAGANEDRAYLLAEVDRQRAENERLCEELALMKAGFEVAYRAMGAKP